jgi:chromosome segregation ATPase
MVDFAKVITVRERKVGAAKSREVTAFQACRAARERLADAREAMESFAAEVKGLEVRLLSDLMKTRITVHDVARLRETLQDANLQAHRLVDQVKRANADLNRHEHHLEDMRVATLGLQSKLKRITELDKTLAESRTKELLKKEDAKMDEFAETMKSRGKF